MANKNSYQIKVLGEVQGVFFRKSTQEKARQLNLKGFVRNENDGSVYIEAEGDEDNLRTLLTWAETGPPAARVKRVISSPQDMKNFKAFEIRQS